MHDFHLENGKLYCESVFVGDIAKQTGTPVYIYSKKTLTDHVKKLQNAFSDTDHVICYSVKSCSNLSILGIVASLGSGMDIVSGGELYRVQQAGVDPAKVAFAGVGKTVGEIEQALDAGIMFFTVESLPELERINTIAINKKMRAPVAIRVNPDVDPMTHTYITTGKAENKFGLAIDAAFDAYIKAKHMEGIDIVGVHMHIGSQLVDPQPYVTALAKMIPFIERLREEDITLKYLDIGGGLGIVYDREEPSTADTFSQLVKPLVKDLGLTLVIEPGRFIAGNSGILVTEVQYIKQNPVKNFIIVDAAMNDLIRPSLYNAFHAVEPVESKDSGTVVADVVGPICESGDFLAKDRQIEKTAEGELLALMSAGAYGFSMSSNYNSRPRAAEVLVDGGDFRVIREREKYEDLVRGEK